MVLVYQKNRFGGGCCERVERGSDGDASGCGEAGDTDTAEKRLQKLYHGGVIKRL
jgi:hypothetical protein